MNTLWARLIIKNLIAQGVRRFCVSPGSRSSPLVYALLEEDLASNLVHFDERGMGFHALGFAKASKEVVALICTSGSAVANLFPAVMEASHAAVPLIVLTADRPPELQDCGSNQACDQIKFFGHYVRWEINLSCPDEKIAENYLSSTIAQAVYRASLSPKGVVHINCPFREPLFQGQVPTSSSSIHYEIPHQILSTSTLERLGKELSKAERGVIIAGSFSTPRSLKSIYDLANHLHWPILPDILSGLRSDHPRQIRYYDAIIKSVFDLKSDYILHLGDRLVSKSLLEWIKAEKYTLVADHPFRHDPTHTITNRVQCDPSLFCEQILPFASYKSSSFSHWKEMSEIIEKELRAFESAFTEFGLMRFLHHHIPAHFALFFANSLPIRYADQFFFPHYFKGPIFGNRGVSGIDGNIATAIGIAEGSQRPTLAVLGDLASLHDLNSLAQIHQSKHPVIFLIINNHGGGIFSFVQNPSKKENFEKFWAASHLFHFEQAAKTFHLPYLHIKDFSSLSKVLKEEKSCIVEMTTSREETHLEHTQIVNHLKTCLNLSSCMVF